MKNSLSDNFLIKQYQQGCEKSLSFLIDRYKNELYTHIYYKVLNHSLAEDIFQDTFIKIIVRLKNKNYKEEGKFFFWAKKIADNLIIDFYRINSKFRLVRDKISSEEEISVLELLTETSKNIEENLILNQIRKDISKMVSCLSEEQQEVIRLRFYEECSFQEIADKTGCNINTVLGRVRYALINLRKIRDKYNIILNE